MGKKWWPVLWSILFLWPEKVGRNGRKTAGDDKDGPKNDQNGQFAHLVVNFEKKSGA